MRERFAPGEYDRDGVDPLHRPPIKHRARTISAEDFADRPRVTFREEFASMHDAGIVLSWLSAADRDAIYQDYLDAMMDAERTAGVTSHEYAMRVVAQRWNVTADRVGAVVELAHAEDRARAAGDVEIHDDLQQYVDRRIAEHIRTAYSEYDETEPGVPFVEPVEHHAPRPSQQRVVRVDDAVDVDAESLAADRRDRARAQRILDEMIYVEDRDEDTVDVDLGEPARELLRNRRRFDVGRSGAENADEKEDVAAAAPVDPNGRSRWKYVAKIIDSTEERKKRKELLSRRERQRRLERNNEDTLVEHNGELRAATMAEADATEWSRPVNRTEFVYKNVKRAWLERSSSAAAAVNGDIGWGRIAAPLQPPQPDAPDAAKKMEDETV